MDKNLFIREIGSGERVDAPFLLQNVEIREKRGGGKYLHCLISDCTGSMTCKVWGLAGDDGARIEELYSTMKPGQVYRISGFAKIFREQCEINVNEGIGELHFPIDPASIDEAQFCGDPVDIEENRQLIESIVRSLGDPVLREFAAAAIGAADGFFIVPGAIYRHHACRGGLAAHTVEVASLVRAMEAVIRVSSFDRDLAIAGALLHDIGKCTCYKRSGLTYIPTPDCGLIGHITPGVQILLSIPGRPDEETFQQLLHIVQAHHGSYGDVMPCTPEAWAVHLADLASAQLHEVAADIAEITPGSYQPKGSRSGSPVFRRPAR